MPLIEVADTSRRLVALFSPNHPEASRSATEQSRLREREIETMAELAILGE